jgi:hypothetical protein
VEGEVSEAERLARCENEIWLDVEGEYTLCPGRLHFRAEDRDAACDTCGARCGSLVADYIDPAGAWPEAQRRFELEVHNAWVADHNAGHPKGRGNCPFCSTTDSQTDAGRQ